MAPVAPGPSARVPPARSQIDQRPNRLPLVALLGATAVSLVGSSLTAIALPWFVLQTTGSAARTGLTAFAVLLPAFAAGILGGPLVDRIGARRTSVLADTISAIGIGLIPLLWVTVGLPFGMLLALVFVGAALEMPGLTARRSILPELAREAGVRLERVNSAYESLQNLSLLLGPPLAGLLIAWLGASRVLWVDAATFILSALLIGTTLPRRASPARSATSYRQDLVAGLRFLRGDRILMTLAVTLTISNFVSGPLFAVLLPVYASDVFGRASALGFAVAAAGAGALVGSVGFGIIGHRLSRRVIWLTAYVVGPVSFWTLAMHPSLPLLMGGLFVEGAAMGAVNPLLVTIRHERIPVELRGRVFGAFSAVATGAQPLGMLVGGFLIEGIGFRATTIILATLAQALGLALLMMPSLRELDSSPDSHGAVHG